jgi:hypothetical protein
MRISNVICTTPNLKKCLCVEHHYLRHPKNKKNVKEKDLEGTSKTLMPLTWVQKPNGGANLEEY